MKNFLSQFQEEENRLFVEQFKGKYPDTTWHLNPNDVEDFIHSSHSRLIDKIVEMVEKEGYGDVEDDDFATGFNSALSLIQQKLLGVNTRGKDLI